MWRERGAQKPGDQIEQTVLRCLQLLLYFQIQVKSGKNCCPLKMSLLDSCKQNIAILLLASRARLLGLGDKLLFPLPRIIESEARRAMWDFTRLYLNSYTFLVTKYILPYLSKLLLRTEVTGRCQWYLVLSGFLYWVPSSKRLLIPSSGVLVCLTVRS